MEKKRLLVTSTSRWAINNALNYFKGKKFRWIYLGEDITSSVYLDKTMAEGSRIQTPGLIDKAAKLLKKPYVDYIGELNAQYNSFEWWANSVSEKNPFRSKTFLYACYLKISNEIEKNYPNDNIVFFVEKKFIRRTLAQNLNDAFLADDFLENLLESLLKLKRFFVYRTWFLLSNVYYILMAKYIYRMQNKTDDRPSVLLYTFINNTSFDEKGDYNEVMFGDLPEHALKTGKNLMIIPQIRIISYKKALDGIKKSKYSFLIPHAFLSFWDIFDVFIKTLSNKSWPRFFPRFEDMDISSLLYEDLGRDIIDHKMALDILLFNRTIRRISEAGISVETLAYPFENMAREKILCMTMRNCYPSAHLVGYQHSTISLIQINHFLSGREASLIPLPDRIITNGKYYRDLLIDSGYPPDKVIEGGAIRYSRLLGLKNKAELLNKRTPTILVTTSNGVPDSKELILKVSKALRDKKGWNVLIKTHPFTPFERLSKNLDVDLPNHFSVSKDRLSSLLSKTDILIYKDSTTAIEAIALGIPIVCVKSDFLLTIDKLDFDDNIKLIAYSPEDIESQILNILNMDMDELSRKRNIWENTLSNLFNPVNEKTYDLFLL